MKNKKLFCLLLSFAVLFCIAVPGTLAISADAATDEEAVVETTGQEEQTADDETVDGIKTPDESTGEETPVSDKIPAADVASPSEENVASGHIEGCSDGCAVEGCTCPCHEKSLFDKLMATETLDELFAIVDETPEEDLLALTDEENAQIEAHIEAINEKGNQDFPSEIVQETVNFSNVAPLGDPVVGGEE